MTNEERQKELFDEAFLDDFEALTGEMSDEQLLMLMNGGLSDREIKKMEKEARAEGKSVVTGFIEFETGVTTVAEIISFLRKYDEEQFPSIFEYDGKAYLGLACLTKSTAGGIDNPLNWEVIA